MNAAFTASGVVATVGQVRLACTCVQVAGQAVDHREEDDVERLLGVHLVQQVVDVRNAELARGSTGRWRRAWRLPCTAPRWCNRE